MKSLNARIIYANHQSTSSEWDDVQTSGPPAPKDQSIILAVVVSLALFVSLICHH